MEPTLTAAVVDVEPILDVVPVPLVALEPGSGRVLHINAAAHGGQFPLEPALRVARGETLTNVQYDWDTDGRLRTVLVSGTTVTAGTRQLALICFEDVTELESGRRRASVQADELEVMLDGIADAVTVQAPDFMII